MKKIILIIILFVFQCSCIKTETPTNNDPQLTLPLAPVDLSGTILTDSKIVLKWTDKSTNEKGFKIQRKVSASNFIDIGFVATDITEFTDENITPSTTYVYRVYSYNSLGPSITYSNEFIVTTWGLVAISTNAISFLSQTLAKSGGTIINDGGSPILERGVVWSTSTNPTIELTTKIKSGNGIGSYNLFISGLKSNTSYYIRAYATNKNSTYYGSEVSFKTENTLCSQFNENLKYGLLTDIDGNNYKTIQIGSQVWMAENLKTTKYSNGQTIVNMTNGSEWGSTTTGAWCYFGNDQKNNTVYGKLYNWYAVNSSNKVCPSGWHVPTDPEWTTLYNTLGGDSTVGILLKSKCPSGLWPSSDATNTSGFSAVPGGSRGFGGDFGTNFGNYGYWWTATKYNDQDAWIRLLWPDKNTLHRSAYRYYTGFSIRCVKD